MNTADGSASSATPAAEARACCSSRVARCQAASYKMASCCSIYRFLKYSTIKNRLYCVGMPDQKNPCDNNPAQSMHELLQLVLEQPLYVSDGTIIIACLVSAQYFTEIGGVLARFGKKSGVPSNSHSMKSVAMIAVGWLPTLLSSRVACRSCRADYSASGQRSRGAQVRAVYRRFAATRATPRPASPTSQDHGAPAADADRPSRGRLYAGTSGFAYPGWSPRFYPAGLAGIAIPGPLRRAAARRRAEQHVLRVTSAAKVATWVGATPAEFRFLSRPSGAESFARSTGTRRRASPG